MSHFAVLVITNEEPTQEVLSKALQPYHEYECTGAEDEYVVDVDVDDEARKLFSEQTRTMWVDGDGKRHSPYEDRFYRDPTPEEAKHIGPLGGMGRGDGIQWASRNWDDGRGYRTKVHKTPEEAGVKEIEVPVSEIESIEEWAEPWGGWKLKNGRFVDRTNPNKKWDWWVVGGRYNGRLRVLPGCSGGKGEGGLGSPVKETGFDYCRRDALDFSAMKRVRETERQEWLNAVVEKAGISANEVDRAFWSIAKLGNEWSSLYEPRPRGAAYYEWLRSCGDDGQLAAQLSQPNFGLPDIAEGQTAEEWVRAAPAISAFALLKDGEWHEKGEMGWWGVVSNPQDEDAWQRFVTATVEGLPPTAWLAFVDCHI